jgi:hypothetical protein
MDCAKLELENPRSAKNTKKLRYHLRDNIRASCQSQKSGYSAPEASTIYTRKPVLIMRKDRKAGREERKKGKKKR